jgi:hypothetical protein
MFYKFKIKERLDGNELIYEEVSDDIEGLKEKYELNTMAEKVMAEALGWTIDEWVNKRGYFFESYDPEQFNERYTSIELIAVL